MARWNRAANNLGLPRGARVLDLGCAFGYGTRFLCNRYDAYGHDLSSAYIDRARRSVPSAAFTCGPANIVPYPDDFFDGVVLLDVLEHVPDERAVLDEIARVLRSQGRLVLSVPNQGWLAPWDSLNVYARWFGSGDPAPTEDPSWTRSPCHRHYSVARLAELLGDDFTIHTAKYTGVGLAEPIQLVLLAVLLRWFRVPNVFRALQYLYFGLYLAEDLLPMGSGGYHLMITASRSN